MDILIVSSGCWLWGRMVRDIITAVVFIGIAVGTVALMIWIDSVVEGRRIRLAIDNPELYAAKERRSQRSAIAFFSTCGLVLVACGLYALFRRWYGC